MKFARILMLCAVTIFVFAITAKATEDPVKVASANYKVILENDEVRVLEFHGKAGDKIPMHFHPDHTAYAIHGGKIKFTADGKSMDMEMKDGEAVFVKIGNHSAEVISGEPHVIIVEMKEELTKK